MVVSADDQSVVDHDKVKAAVLKFLYEQPGRVGRWRLCRLIEDIYPTWPPYILGSLVRSILSRMVITGQITRTVVDMEDKFWLTASQWLIMTRSRMSSSSSCTSSRTLAATGKISASC